MLVVEADKSPVQTELDFIYKFKALGMPAILVINKIDMIKDKEILMKQILEYSKLYDFEAIVPVSASDGNGMNELLEELKKQASEEAISLKTIPLQTSPKELLPLKLSERKF